MKAKMFHVGWVLFATRNMIYDMMLEDPGQWCTPAFLVSEK
jgi:hypothetical protein